MSSGELGTTLRHWRDRVTPADVGLPAGNSRRAVGLRREELALLAGVSVDYLTRLEQGRAENPSAQVVGAISRALRLTDAERGHLFRLAGQPVPDSGFVNSHLTPSVQRLLDQLQGVPAGVCDAGWTLVAWNPMWAALQGDPSGRHGRERNVAWAHFTGAPTWVIHTPEQADAFEAALVADLRQSTGRYPKDVGLQRLIAELAAASTRFAELWEQRAVGRHQMADKTVRHPAVGDIAVDCDVLSVDGSDLRIVLMSAAAGSESAQKLQLLSVIGTQPLGVGD